MISFKTALGIAAVALTISSSALSQQSVITNQSVRYSALTISGNGGKPALTITADGELLIGEGYTPTEAGDAFIEALRPQLSALFHQSAAP